MSRHMAPRNPRHIGERLTVAAVHLILATPLPSPTAAGQPGRHHEDAR
jgi:hypothetical protein